MVLEKLYTGSLGKARSGVKHTKGWKEDGKIAAHMSHHYRGSWF